MPIPVSVRKQMGSMINFDLASNETKRAYIIGRLLLSNSALNPESYCTEIDLKEFFEEIPDFSSHAGFFIHMEEDIIQIFRHLTGLDVGLKYRGGVPFLYFLSDKDKASKKLQKENERLKKEVEKLRKQLGELERRSFLVKNGWGPDAPDCIM